MKYMPALDGLRAVAVLLVVLFHAFPNRFPGGWMGVDIFFVLSGYLITTILTAEIRTTGHISYSRFYARRALRLLPEASCVFAFQFVRAIFSSTGFAIVQATFVSIFYFMNWSRAFELFPQDVLGHMWSLSMEEQFYFIWPFVLAMIIGRRPITCTVAMISMIISWRCFLVLGGASADRTYNGFDTHGDALLIGCLLSFLPAMLRHKLGRLGWPALAGFLIAFGVAPYDAPGMQLIGMSIVAGSAMLMVSAALATNALARLLSLPPLIFTGRISYGWYLWHYPILMIGFNHGFKGPIFKACLIALSYIAAVISYFAIALPAQRLKRRFASGAEQKRATLLINGGHGTRSRSIAT